MPLIRIAELDADRRLDPYRALKQTNDTARRGLFIAEGDKLVRRLLGSSLRTESVLLSEAYVAELSSILPERLPAFVVPDDALRALVGYDFHRGILACGVRPAPLELDTLVSSWNIDDRRRTLVVCPDVQDPENLGSIVRIAAGFGIDGILLGPRSADPFSRRVQRVSMGNVYGMPITQLDDIAGAIVRLRRAYGVESWATVLDAEAETLGTRARPTRLAIVFGSEGHGIPADVVAACDRKVIVPMQAGVDSLNVAVAAGIFLYELSKPAA
ncbi:MAG: RNA methyltransferase [Planctomycetia bacterium]|nr:RNA methyltransferase [Planctomycetia bacterium]